MVIHPSGNMVSIFPEGEGNDRQSKGVSEQEE
jgi:hypothetical protein